MDGKRFDDITRAVARGVTRRKVIGGLLAAMATALNADRARADPPRRATCKLQTQGCGRDSQCCFGLCCNHRCCWPGAICDERGECAFPPPEPPPPPLEPGDECNPLAGCDGPGCPDGCFCTVTAGDGIARCVKAAGNLQCGDEICSSNADCDKGFCVLDECGLCNPQSCVENLRACPRT